MEKKYKKTLAQLEMIRGVNKQMKEKVKRASSSGVGANRFRSSHTRVAKLENGFSMRDVKRMESTVERMRSDMRFLQTQNEDLKMRAQSRQRSKGRDLARRYEGEKSKNLYLENENIQLRKQIRELNSKYKLHIDERNRQTVGDFVGRKSVITRELEEARGANVGLRKENRELREKALAMSNELKMKSNISEAISRKEQELGQLRSGLNQMQEENNYLRGKVMQLEMEIASLKETLRLREVEIQKMGSGNNHMVKMYQKLYNDMKNNCEIYMDKVKQLSAQLQSSSRQGHLTYTKNVYQSTVHKMARWSSTRSAQTTWSRTSSARCKASFAKMASTAASRTETPLSPPRSTPRRGIQKRGRSPSDTH